VLFISGATGDAGHWTKVADALAGEYTVLTYDRRANSRSLRTNGRAAADHMSVYLAAQMQLLWWGNIDCGGR
jgi:pimeloyl-ACP methyl ester carboxylesterase